MENAGRQQMADILVRSDDLGLMLKSVERNLEVSERFLYKLPINKRIAEDKGNQRRVKQLEALGKRHREYNLRKIEILERYKNVDPD